MREKITPVLSHQVLKFSDAEYKKGIPVCKMERLPPAKLIKASRKIIVFVNLKSIRRSYGTFLVDNQIGCNHQSQF